MEEDNQSLYTVLPTELYMCGLNHENKPCIERLHTV